MPEYTVRSGQEGDEPRMRPLWRAGFGDTEAFLDCYARRMFRPERVELALCGGEIVSMVTVLPSWLCMAGGERIPCGCVYGVATLPAHRGRGLAGRLLARAGVQRLGRSMDCIAVVPDTMELFPYYAHAMGGNTAFYVREPCVTAEQLSGAAPRMPVQVRAEEYLPLRRAALRGRTYIDWDENAVRFEEEICRDAGGGLFCFPDAPGCCAAGEYREDGSLLVCELLASEEELPRCLAGLFARFRAEEGTVRLPAWSGDVLGAEVIPFGIMNGVELSPEEQAYLGFDFD